MTNYKNEWSYKVLDLQKITDKQADIIVNTSASLLDKIPNEKNNIESNVGLLVGKVQSGKTSVMISTSAMAFQNGHKLVIALLSDTELLLTQNYNRIFNTFSQLGDIDVLQVSKSGDFVGVSSEELKYMYSTGRKIFVCALKNKTRLSQISNKFLGTGYDNDFTLIFDDEGDDISQNTAKEKGKFGVDDEGKYVEKKFSATNNAIKDLKKTFSKVGYVSVTATPQSIVLLQGFQHLSPDYVLTTPPGIGYCGLTFFHTEHRSELIKITSSESEILSSYQGIPEDLKEAFAHFIAGCYFRSKHETKDFKHSMMIHSSRLINEHEILFKKIKPYVEQIKDGLLKKRVIATEFVEMVNNELKEITKENVSITPCDLVPVFNALKVTSLNGRSDVKDMKQIQKYLPYHLFIGGDLLDRGVTIDGLAVVYIVRESKIAQMDTLLQRARWFGYKYDYINTCKIYLTELLDKQFMEMVPTDEMIWDMLVECSQKNISPRDFDFDFELNPKIIVPTSKSKASFETTIAGLKVSQRFVMMNPSFNEDNIKLIQDFKKLFETKIVPTKYGPQNHDRVQIQAKYVIEFLKQFKFSHEDSKCNHSQFESTLKILKFDGESMIDVLFMNRPEGVEERSTVKPNTNELVGLLQGHSPNKSIDDPTYYKGDRYIVENNPMVQIHMVTLKNDVKIDGTKVMLTKGTLTPMIAWMFPEHSYEKIVVRKKDITI